MPSYIELDKQSSFPASSNSGKVILGINNSNQLQATNSSGQSIGVTGLPYQVYTALLTQSGGDDTLSINEGLLTIGVTYIIQEHFGTDDFTNVGAPNNNNGTSFVAIGTTPTKWTDFSNLTYNPGAPVVTVLENTIGNIWWTYGAIGQYIANSTSLFAGGKTAFFGNTYYYSNNASYVDCLTDTISNNDTSISVWSYSRADNTTIDGVLINTPIEIRVYN